MRGVGVRDSRNEEVERLLRREAEAELVMEAEQAVAAEPEPTSGDAEEGVPPEQEHLRARKGPR